MLGADRELIPNLKKNEPLFHAAAFSVAHQSGGKHSRCHTILRALEATCASFSLTRRPHSAHMTGGFAQSANFVRDGCAIYLIAAFSFTMHAPIA